jgi:hypothetical protein
LEQIKAQVSTEVSEARGRGKGREQGKGRVSEALVALSYVWNFGNRWDKVQKSPSHVREPGASTVD